MLITIEKVLALKQLSLFKTVSNMALSDLMAVSEEQTLKKGVFLLEKDKQNNALYFILSGDIAIEQGGDKTAVGSNEIVGLASVFWIAPAGVNAYTERESVVLKVNRDKLYRIMALHPSLASALLDELSRLIHENRKNKKDIAF